MEKPRFGFKTRADEAFSKLEQDRLSKEEAQRKEKSRKSELIARKQASRIERIPDILSQLDSLDIPTQLDEINREIWGNHGEINISELVDKQGRRVCGKKLSLKAEVPIVKEVIYAITRSVFGPYYVSSYEYSTFDGPIDTSHTEIGWTSQTYGSKVEGYEKVMVPHELSVFYFIPPEFEDVAVLEVDDNRYRNPGNSPTPWWEARLEFDPNSFKLSEAEDIILYGLEQSNLERTIKPIEDIYDKAESEMERITKLIGTRHYDYGVEDPTPFLRRIQRALFLNFF